MTLHVEELGAGSPLLLVGGAPTSSAYLRPLARRLAARHRVLRPDLPGYERSAALPEPYSLAEAARLLAGVLTDRGLTSAALVGFSFGAWRVLQLAAAGLVRPTAIVCLAGVAWLSPEEQEGFQGVAAALRAGADLASSLPGMFLTPGFAAAHPEAVAGVRGWLAATTPAALAAELEATRDLPDLRPAIAELTCPVVARVGQHDRPSLVAHARDIAAAARDGALQIVPGAGHALLYEDAAATAAAIAAATAR